PFATDSLRCRPPTERRRRSESLWNIQGGGSPTCSRGSTQTTIATSATAWKVWMLWSSIGFPATQRNCFSSFDPVREPLPAATMMTPTSGFIWRDAGRGRREAGLRDAERERSTLVPYARLPPPAYRFPP